MRFLVCAVKPSGHQNGGKCICFHVCAVKPSGCHDEGKCAGFQVHAVKFETQMTKITMTDQRIIENGAWHCRS